ncbi:MAG TPA: hypothetical protein VE379_07445, partial [Vicinamibacterales bacterium]|nr:hypothetical protein [Vicinamibacterales bacterium]
AAGLAAGLALSWAFTRTMRSLLYGIGAGDPGAYGAAVALLGLIALIACGLPALRAARVDPIQVLRQD